MREDQDTAHRLAAYSDAVFAVIVTIMVLELEAPEEASFAALWPLWPTVISYAVSYLFIAIIWINHHHLMRFVGAPDARVDLGQLRPSVPGVALALCDCLGRAHSFRVLACGVLRSAVRLRRQCLQHLRARRPGARSGHARIRARAACGEASINRRSGDLFDRDAGRVVAPRVAFTLICCALILHLRPDVTNR
jgi:hypothetical protein